MKAERVYIYTILPIDNEWEHLVKLSDYVKKSFDETDEGRDAINLFSVGCKFAKYFEGDIACGPCVTFIPKDDYGMQLVVVWKQSNNGTSFAASYQPIISLELSEDIEKVIV